MRYFLALLVVLFLSACMSDPEERNFYYGGWTHPEKAADQRMNTR